MAGKSFEVTDEKVQLEPVCFEKVWTQESEYEEISLSLLKQWHLLSVLFMW